MASPPASYHHPPPPHNNPPPPAVSRPPPNLSYSPLYCVLRCNKTHTQLPLLIILTWSPCVINPFCNRVVTLDLLWLRHLLSTLRNLFWCVKPRFAKPMHRTWMHCFHLFSVLVMRTPRLSHKPCWLLCPFLLIMQVQLQINYMWLPRTILSRLS